MDKELESRIERLCLRYLETQASLESVRPIELPTGRSIRRLRGQVADALIHLRTSRAPSSGALVRLAYVRGMRSVDPKARLTEATELEVDFLERRLDQDLRRIEAAAFGTFKGHLRKLKVAQTLSQHDYPTVTIQALTNHNGSYPLEQRARASIRTIVDTALRAGVSSATNGGGYDGGRNADG